MADIREFLLARIAEDEATLERTGPFPHSTHGRDVVGTYSAECPDCIGVPSRERVVAECLAKRAIISEHSSDWGDCVVCLEGRDAACGDPACCGPSGNVMKQWPCPTLRAIAAVYANHPDYQQEWARG